MDTEKAIGLVKEAIQTDEHFCARYYDGKIPPVIADLLKAQRLAVAALEKQVAKPCKVVKKEYYQLRYYCPECGKQQKETYKIRREGCFCERCGQRVTLPDVGGADPVSTTEFVIEIG